MTFLHTVQRNHDDDGTKLTVPPSFHARPLVYHSDRQALSAAQFRRAGQLATADTRVTND